MTLQSQAKVGGGPFIAVCSAKPRPMVQSNRNRMLKTGEAAWGRDPYHLLGEGKRTLCGRDASEWLTIGPVEDLDRHCCFQCRRKAEEQGS